MLIRRNRPNAGSSEGGGSLDGGRLGVDYPALVEFLTANKWEDDKPRIPGTFGLSVDEDRFRARLCDRDAGLVCFLSSDDLDALLAAVNGGLQRGDLEWRKDRFQAGGNGRKRG